MTIDIHRYITIKHKMLIILKSCEHNNFCDLYVLTTTVDTLLGNTLAVIAKSAVMQAAQPRASIVRQQKHITMYIVPSGHLSSTLK